MKMFLIAPMLIFAISAFAHEEVEVAPATVTDRFLGSLIGHNHPYSATKNGFTLSANGIYCQIHVERDGDVLSLSVCSTLGFARSSGNNCGSLVFKKGDKPNESSMFYETFDPFTQQTNVIKNEPRLKLKAYTKGNIVKIDFIEPKMPPFLSEDRVQRYLKFELSGERKDELGVVTIYSRSDKFNSPDELEYSCKPL